MKRNQIWVHLVARAANGRSPFDDRAVAATAWSGLKNTFPHAYACVLMPDHLHLIAQVPAVGDARIKLSRILSGLTRKFSAGAGAWEPTPAPSIIPNRHHLLRQVRYVHLNPCRAGLSRDPLAWEWSTHRDYLGLTIDDWIHSPKAVSDLRLRSPAEFHRYVSSDPSVNVSGTPFPRVTKRQNLLWVGQASGLDSAIRKVLRSGASTCRDGRNLRTAALALADREFKLRPRDLTKWLGVSPGAIRQARKRSLDLDLERLASAVVRMLADPRFH